MDNSKSLIYVLLVKAIGLKKEILGITDDVVEEVVEVPVVEAVAEEKKAPAKKTTTKKATTKKASSKKAAEPAKVTVTFKGNYTGTLTKTFKITQKDAKQKTINLFIDSIFFQKYLRLLHILILKRFYFSRHFLFSSIILTID